MVLYKVCNGTSFVEIMKFALIPLILYTIKVRFDKCSEISFVDFTPLKV